MASKASLSVSVPLEKVNAAAKVGNGECSKVIMNKCRTNRWKKIGRYAIAGSDSSEKIIVMGERGYVGLRGMGMSVFWRDS